MIPAQKPHTTASASAANSSTVSSSTYYDRLHPWCIIRHLPNLQRTTIARFRHCNHAEAHLLVLRQLTPNATYSLIFEMENAQTHQKPL